MEPSMATTPRTQLVLLFSFFALSFLLSFCNCADPVHLFENCPNTTLYSSNSTYQSNLNTLFSSLSSNATSNYNNLYSNATVGQSPDAVYGLYYCRGDVTHDMCSNCIKAAVRKIAEKCPNRKVVFIWYDECILRYSNHSFFSSVSEDPGYSMRNTADISDPTRFNQILADTMNKAAITAASDSERFATLQANFTVFQHLYCLVQCSPDLAENECNRCLVGAIAHLPSCCNGKLGGRVINPSCKVRYEVYPFYRITSPSPTLPAPLPPSNNTTSPGESLLSFQF